MSQHEQFDKGQRIQELIAGLREPVQMRGRDNIDFERAEAAYWLEKLCGAQSPVTTEQTVDAARWLQTYLNLRGKAFDLAPAAVEYLLKCYISSSTAFVPLKMEEDVLLKYLREHVPTKYLTTYDALVDRITTTTRSATGRTLEEALHRCADYHGDDALLDAPCIFCGYNGAGYWQKGTHSKDCRLSDVGGFDDRRKALLRREQSDIGHTR